MKDFSCINDQCPEMDKSQCEGCRERNYETMLKHIKSHGWAMVYIVSEGPIPSFAYTVGFYESIKKPEVILFGPPPEEAIQTFHRIYDVMQMEDKEIVPGDYNYDILHDNYPVIFKEVEYSLVQEYFCFGCDYYDDKCPVFPAYQFIWPDQDRLFPWEENFNPKLEGRQKLI